MPDEMRVQGHPFAAQCLRLLLPAKLLLDFPVFLATLPARWPDCHRGRDACRKGREAVWFERDLTLKGGSVRCCGGKT